MLPGVSPCLNGKAVRCLAYTRIQVSPLPDTLTDRAVWVEGPELGGKQASTGRINDIRRVTPSPDATNITNGEDPMVRIQLDFEAL